MSIDPSRVRVRGPLALFAAGFADELARQGYTPLSARNQMWLLAHLSHWIERQGLGVDELRATEVDRFVRARRVSGRRQLRSIKALRPILAYLRVLGVAPPPLSTSDGPVDEVLERYRSYLTVERGLGNATASGYVHMVRPFLQCGFRRRRPPIPI